MKKRQEIAGVAINYFLERGVKGTSMRTIAKGLNMSIGTLYYYFNSKDEIIDMVADLGVMSFEEFQKFYTNLGNISVSESLYKCMIYLILHGHKSRDRILFFNREYQNISPSKSKSLREVTMKHILFFEQLLDTGIKTGEFKVENPKMLAFNIWVLQQEWVLHRWAWLGVITVEEFAKQQADFILKSISVRDPALVRTSTWSGR